MAWGDPSDYWWLKPVQPAQVSPAMKFGAELRQQAIGNALKRKDLELENQRTGIQIQKYFSEKELELYKQAGIAALAKRMSGFKDMTDPAIPEVIYGELAKSPMLAPIAEHFLDDHRKAVEYKQKQEQIKASRDQAGYVPPDEETGAPGYFQDAKGGIRFSPQQKPKTESPKWVPANKETGMPAHFETDNGGVRFAPKAMPDGSTFQPEEVVTAGGTRMVRVSPNKFQVLDKPTMTGRMTDLERQRVMDLRSKRNILLQDLGDPPPLKDRSSGMWKSYNQKLSDIDVITGQLNELYGKIEARTEKPAPSAPSGALPLNTTLKQPLTLEKAKDFLNQAGGDKEKARKMAQDAGFEF